MKNRFSQFNVSKVTGTVVHASGAGGALEVAVVGTKTHIEQSTNLGQSRRNIICLGMLNLYHRKGFLHHQDT